MNFKTTYILFAILGLFLAVFGLTQLLGLRRPDERSAYVLPSLNDVKAPIKPEDIERVEIVRVRPTEEKLAFVRTGNGWMLEQPAVRVETYQIERVIDQVRSARIEQKADVTNNPKQFGLDVPAATVTLTKKGGEKQWQLFLGNESPGGDSAVVYVTSSDHAKVTAVRKNDLDSLFKKVHDFRSRELLTAGSFNTEALTLQPADKEAVTLEKTADKWKFVKPAYGDAETESPPAPLPPAGAERQIASVTDLLNSLSNPRVEDTADFVANDVSDADMAEKYGLESGKPATLRIEVKRTDGSFSGTEEKKPPVTEVLLIGRKVASAKDEHKDDKKPIDQPQKYYARLEGERAVVAVSAKSVEPLLKVALNPDVLRNRDLVQVDTAKVDAVDLKSPQGYLKLRRTGSPATWKLYTAGPSPRAADEQTISGLLNALTAKRLVKSFPDKKDEELGLDKPVAEVALWVDGIQPEEKKDDKTEEKKDAKAEDKQEAKADDKKDSKPEEKKDAKAEDKQEARADDKKPADAEPKLKSEQPKVRLYFGKKENDVVYVRREIGDEKARLAVPENLLARVLEGPLAYLDRTLPSWPSEAEPVKVTLTRGSETFEFEREKKDDKSPVAWRLKQPAPVAGRSADSRTLDRIISDLRTLTTDKLVAEKPSDADLERYGLKPPAFRVSVSLELKDKKTEEREYLIGKELDDKSGRYARLGTGDLIFVVRPELATDLQGEVLDPTVLTFDLAKVQGLKLTGWQTKLGAPYHFDLERKSSGEWTVKSPPAYQLNKTQAESFLTSLNNLRALRFVVSKAGPKPEHKLDVKDGAMLIEIVVEGQKEPLQLTIGALSTADKAYFAATNKLEGDVFLVEEDRFKAVLEGPGYFK